MTSVQSVFLLTLHRKLNHQIYLSELLTPSFCYRLRENCGGFGLNVIHVHEISYMSTCSNGGNIHYAKEKEKANKSPVDFQGQAGFTVRYLILLSAHCMASR